MKYHYAHIELEGIQILLILVEFEFLPTFQGWRYKGFLLKKHGGDVILIGYKEEDDGKYVLEAGLESSVSDVELDALDWTEDEVTSLA